MLVLPYKNQMRKMLTFVNEPEPDKRLCDVSSASEDHVMMAPPTDFPAVSDVDAEKPFNNRTGVSSYGSLLERRLSDSPNSRAASASLPSRL